MTTKARRTFNALDQHYYQVGTDDPSVVATDGLAGTLYLQIPVYPASSPVKMWQKQDNGETTNWTQVGSGVMDYKSPVRAASTGDVNIASAPANIDGVALNSGDRVLLKNQAAPAENGIYDFNGAGSAMTRSEDANTDEEVTYGLFTWVIEGTVNQLTGWILTTPDPITLGVTALTFVQIPIPGIMAVGAIDSQPKSANGAVIVGTDIIFQTADGGFPGMLSLTSQNIVGEKSFSEQISGFMQTLPTPAVAGGAAALYAADLNSAAPDNTTGVWYQKDAAGNVRRLNGEVQDNGVVSVRAPQFINFIGATITPNGLGVNVEVTPPLADGTEFRTVTVPEAAAKQLTLANTPDDPTKVTVSIGGIDQFYGDDYTVAGNVLDWNGLGMDALPVAAGDKLVIGYGY